MDEEGQSHAQGQEDAYATQQQQQEADSALTMSQLGARAYEPREYTPATPGMDASKMRLMQVL